MFGRQTSGHEVRYALAAGLLRPGDVVVDAACGIGYGALLLDAHDDVTYYGVDRDISVVSVKAHAQRTFIEADLETWKPTFEFDVAVGFETIEHLEDYEPYLEWARRARRYIVVSVPIVPTKHENVFHVHDFKRDDIVQHVKADGEWQLLQYFDQPWEHSCVYVFSRRGVSPIDPSTFRRGSRLRRAVRRLIRRR
jgi:cyclopropane fatty-acyl-phospholipid synthase-like methyltransferase